MSNEDKSQQMAQEYDVKSKQAMDEVTDEQPPEVKEREVLGRRFSSTATASIIRMVSIWNDNYNLSDRASVLLGC